MYRTEERNLRRCAGQSGQSKIGYPGRRRNQGKLIVTGAGVRETVTPEGETDMRISHIAMYVRDLEVVKEFTSRFLGAKAGESYIIIQNRTEKLFSVV